MTVSDDDDFSSEHTLVGDRARVVHSSSSKQREQAYIIVIAGPNVGEMFRVEQGGEIGRGQDVAFRLSDSEISRKHAQFLIQDGQVILQDLGSTNGTLINGHQIQTKILHDGDKIQVGTTTILKFSYHDDLEEQFQRQMYEAAIRDGLTKAYNKKHFTERLENEVAYAARYQLPLALFIFDIDLFKNVNDSYGHLSGDYILSKFANYCLNNIRRGDIFARYGGEEFALISRGLDATSASQFAERIRAGIEKSVFEYHGHRISVTVSIGIATMPECPVSTAEQLITAADASLYEAKNQGRNRVIVYGKIKETPAN